MDGARGTKGVRGSSSLGCPIVAAEEKENTRLQLISLLAAMTASKSRENFSLL